MELEGSLVSRFRLFAAGSEADSWATTGGAGGAGWGLAAEAMVAGCCLLGRDFGGIEWGMGSGLEDARFRVKPAGAAAAGWRGSKRARQAAGGKQQRRVKGNARGGAARRRNYYRFGGEEAMSTMI